MKLVIANRNYSSWSMRAWVLLRAAGIDFEEERLSFLAPDFKARALAHSPAGRVPVLVDGELAVWDSLAIAEYAAERFPQHALWPSDRADRAVARAACAEMHAGFAALRTHMPMNITARLPGRGWRVDVQADIERIVALWGALRARHRAAGPYLFGRFSVADAYYAPVVMRFRTYAPPLPAAADEYMRTMLALAAVREWMDGAAQEHEFVREDEPYRTAPTGNDA
jgi:glutathione S-transferase